MLKRGGGKELPHQIKGLGRMTGREGNGGSSRRQTLRKREESTNRMGQACNEEK